VLFLILLVLACGLTALVNPYGTRLLRIWFYLSGPSVLPQYILEHMPLDPSDFGGRCVLVFGGVYVAALLTTLPRWPRVTWLIPIVWFALACKSIRHGPLFAITAGMSLADIVPHTHWARWLTRQDTYLYREQPEQLPIRWPDWTSALVPVLIVCAATVLQIGQVRVPLLGHDWARLDPNYWPLEARPQLDEFADGTPIFNDMLFGGFLIQYAPNVRVFVDDRCELYGDDFLQAYFEAERGHPEQIDIWARQYGVEWALVTPSPDSGFDGYLSRSDSWTPVRKSEAAVLYRRRTNRTDP
jgi:hypothetical protein